MNPIEDNNIKPPTHFGTDLQAEQLNLYITQLEKTGYIASRTDLLSEVYRQSQELQMLHQIRVALLSNTDLNYLFQAAVEAVAGCFTSPLVALYLLGNSQLHLKAHKGYEKLNQSIAPSHGICGQVAQSGLSVLVEDVKQEPGYMANVPGVHSQLAVPLIHQGNEIIGVLLVESTKEAALNEREMRLCRTAADYVVLAVETSRSHSSEQRRADQLLVLNRIGRELVSLLDVSEIISRITGSVRRRLNYYSVNVGLIVEDKLVFSIGSSEKGVPENAQVSLPLSEDTLTTYAVSNGELVLVHDVSQDSRYRRMTQMPRTKSEIVLPLRDANRIIGVLDVQSDRVFAFDDDEVILLKTLADQTSIAIANALRFQDISLQKEELGRTNQALAEANRLKNEFLANISHELRTPLNSIMGYVEMIQSEFYGLVPKTFNDPLERVERNSRRLLNLINDVLDLSKLEAGRENLQIEKFALAEVIRFSCDPTKEQAIGQGLTFSCEIDPALPRIVENDSRRLSQILTNLLSNALKFTQKGQITVKALPATTANGQTGYKIMVRDTGIGIAKENFEHIFESFRQVDGSTTRMFGGAGMGLTICLKLVSMMRGSIEVESEVGKGSTFTITLPAVVS